MVLPILIYLGIAGATYATTQIVDYFTDKPEQQNIIYGGSPQIDGQQSSSSGILGLSLGTLAIVGVVAYFLLKK